MAATAIAAAAGLCPIGAAAAGAATTPAHLSGRRLIASDAFGRHVSRGIGKAHLGGSWRIVHRRPATASVSGGAARLRKVPRGSSANAWLSTARARDVEALFTLAMPIRSSAGSGNYLAAEVRRHTDGRAYRAKLSFAKSGQARLSIVRTTARGVEHTLGYLALDWSLRAAQHVKLEILASGTKSVTVSARAWRPGTRTPAWQLTVQDGSSARVSTGGRIGFWGYRSKTARSAAWQIAGMRAWSVTVSRSLAARPVSSKPAPAPTPVPAPNPGNGSSTDTQPNARNTGVPTGTDLTSVRGTLNITRPGVYSGLDVHGFVHVLASNVTIKNSILRGGVATGDIGLVNAVSGASNFVIEDSELVPEHPSVYIDGITGWNYTARRLNIHGTVDGAKMFGNDATIESSYIHDLAYYAADPNQNGNPTHNDAIQVLGGHRLHIVGNTLEGGDNSALQVTQSHGSVTGLEFSGNWAGGGACTVNLQDAPLSSMSGIAVTKNHFARTSTYNCPILAYAGVTYSTSGNTWSDGSAPVPVIRRAS